MEAAEAGIALIICITEGIPVTGYGESEKLFIGY